MITPKRSSNVTPAWEGKVLNHFESRFAVFAAVQQLRCSTMDQYHATLVGQYHNHLLFLLGYCPTWSLTHWSHPIAKSDNHQLKLWSSSGRCVYLLSGLDQCLAAKIVTAPNFSSLSFFLFRAFFRRSVGSGKEYRWINWKPMKLNLGERVEVEFKFDEI